MQLRGRVEQVSGPTGVPAIEVGAGEFHRNPSGQLPAIVKADFALDWKVCGSGVLTWSVFRLYRVTLFESAAYFGGHANTVDVTIGSVTHPVDTGFLVFNEVTYPNLVRLFATLQVEVYASDMSFSVSIERPEIEWCGTSLSTVFAQTRNLVRPAFWRMIIDIVRFNRNAQRYLEEARANPCTLGDLLDTERYGVAVRDWYLLPMPDGAVWLQCFPRIFGYVFNPVSFWYRNLPGILH